MTGRMFRLLFYGYSGTRCVCLLLLKNPCTRRTRSLDCGASGAHPQMVMIKQGVDICTSVVSQALVYEYCHLGHMTEFLPKIIAHYRKCDAMAAAFKTTPTRKVALAPYRRVVFSSGYRYPGWTQRNSS